MIACLRPDASPSIKDLQLPLACYSDYFRPNRSNRPIRITDIANSIIPAYFL